MTEQRAQHSTGVYLDYNATTPCHADVVAAMLRHIDGSIPLGNSSSTQHRWGRASAAALQQARQQVAIMLSCSPGEVIFTGGATEANNLAVAGCASGHVVTSAIEHPAVLQPVLARQAAGRGDVSIVPVSPSGVVDADAVLAAIRPGHTVLVSVMLANNEVGTLQPVAEVARRIKQLHPEILVHTDASQACGKVPVDVAQLGVDLLTIAGHKMYAAPGVGALYLRAGTRLDIVMHGASHEGGRRAGTHNIPAIAGLGMAAALVSEHQAAWATRMAETRDALQQQLVQRYPSAVVHAAASPRLPNTLSIAIPGAPAAQILAEIGEQVAASAGSACHASGDGAPGTEAPAISPVLAAMGVPVPLATATFRLSTGIATSLADVQEAARVICQAIDRHL